MQLLSTQVLFSVVACASLLLTLYLALLRPWHLKWGATDDETRQTLPGDDLVVDPTFNATRAITINAPPEAVWGWLVQMGTKQAGWYSYDWIDNLGIPSAEQLLPEFQHLEIGKIVPMTPDGKIALWVKDFEINHWLLWWDQQGSFSWCWVLYPLNDNQTRLVSRERLRYHWWSPMILFELMLDVGDIVMMQKSLRGIKQRAEAIALSAQSYNPEGQA